MKLNGLLIIQLKGKDLSLLDKETKTQMLTEYMERVEEGILLVGQETDVVFIPGEAEQPFDPTQFIFDSTEEVSE